MSEHGRTQDLEDLLDALRREAQGKANQRLTLGDVVDRFRHRPAGTLLLVPAIVMISPLGAIPTVPTTAAVLVVLVAVQLLFARSGLWIPGFLRHRGLSTGKVARAVEKSRPGARFLDRLIRPRLVWMTGPVGRRLIALGCVALALFTPPLELLPFAVYLPGTAILLLSLALVGRDGLLAVAGLTLAAVGIAVMVGGLL